MRPAARLQALSELLVETLSSTRAADQIVKHWGRENRYAGSKDRRFLSQALFTILRHYGALEARLGSDDPLLICMLAHCQSFDDDIRLSLDEVVALADGQAYAPPVLTPSQEETLRAAYDRPSADALNVAGWMVDDLQAGLGDEMQAVMAAMMHRAPLDVRVNGVKGDAASALAALRDEGFEVEAHSHVDTALRVSLPANITQSKCFTQGRIEVQDAGAQAVALLANAQPGDTVLDYCAGAGGKALAMAAQMQNQGRVIAHDSDTRRMRPLKPRAARAGVDIIETADDLLALKNACQLVMADVPCSGSGRWRRAPETKWRLSAQQLAALHKSQAEILDAAASYVAPGGRLVYVTCSLLASENSQMIERFLSEQTLFRLLKTEIGADAAAFAQTCARDGMVQMHPVNCDTDGLFCAILVCEEPDGSS